MIILPKLRRVIVTPPRCGSTTLRAMLVAGKRPHGYLVLDPVKELHTPFIPQLAAAFRVSLLVRDPYARAASLWKRMCQFQDKSPEFSAYAADLAAGKIDRWFIGWTCADYEDAIRCAGQPATPRRPDHTIHLERLAEDLRRIGIDQPVEHKNATDPIPLDKVYTGAARDHIQQWAARDFERYGYSRSANKSSGRSVRNASCG